MDSSWQQFRHDPKRLLAPLDALHVVEGVAQAGDVALLRRAGHVRGQHDIIQAEERVVGRWRLLVEDIEAGAGDDLVLQRLYERIVNQLELAEVRGAGMLMAMVFNPVIGSKWLPVGGQIVGELTGLLAQRAFYQGGVQLNFTLNVAKALRVTPAMNMPEDLFEELLLKLEHTVERTQSSTRLLTGTSKAELLSLAGYVLKNG